MLVGQVVSLNVAPVNRRHSTAVVQIWGEHDGEIKRVSFPWRAGVSHVQPHCSAVQVLDQLRTLVEGMSAVAECTFQVLDDAAAEVKE